MKKKLSLAVLLASAPVLAAAANDPWDSPFTLQLGAFSAKADTTVRLDSEIGGGIGTSVSFEGDLGIADSKTVPQFDFLWRINPRHAIEGSYISLERSGTRTLSGQINWGEVSFPVSTAVDSSFDTDTLRVAYRWSPINNNGNELALLLGLHYTKMKASITSSGGVLADEASVDYPLPTIGARASARIADNWRVTGFGQFLKLKIDEYDGELVNLGVALEWAFSRSAFAGLGYNYYRYKLTSEKANARGEFDFTFDGPQLYAGWSF